jgi:hypothetical protein
MDKWIVENGHFALNSILNSSKVGCWFHQFIFLRLIAELDPLLSFSIKQFASLNFLQKNGARS